MNKSQASQDSQHELGVPVHQSIPCMTASHEIKNIPREILNIETVGVAKIMYSKSCKKIIIQKKSNKLNLKQYLCDKHVFTSFIRLTPISQSLTSLQILMSLGEVLRGDLVTQDLQTKCLQMRKGDFLPVSYRYQKINVDFAGTTRLHIILIGKLNT